LIKKAVLLLGHGERVEIDLLHFIEEREEGRKGEGCFLHQWIGTSTSIIIKSRKGF
jgi:hypothetical protein